jgi:hypothetical protein
MMAERGRACSRCAQTAALRLLTYRAPIFERIFLDAMERLFSLRLSVHLS